MANNDFLGKPLPNPLSRPREFNFAGKWRRKTLISNHTTQWDKMLVEKLILIQLVKKFTEYKEREISLPLTKQLATYPYLEPEESNSRKKKINIHT